MAQARIRYEWPTHGVLDCEIYVGSNYPDSVAEAKAQALALFTTALHVLAIEAEDSDG